MTDSIRCPRCQSSYLPTAAGGLCPVCLLAAGAKPPGDSAGTRPDRTGFVAPLPADLAPHFPHLEILSLIGQGGMGSVYKARQRHLGRLIALKVMRPDLSTEPAFAERFAREARGLAGLNHPHLVTVHDFGQQGPWFWIVMELVEGANLRQLLASGRLTPQQALAIIPQVCEALQYAHDHGAVHRDIKPENILLDQFGQVKIADFGLVKLALEEQGQQPLTASQDVLGTAHYRAPEQIERSHGVDHRADIYSLGVVFYEMLTGGLPLGRFAPPSHASTADQRLDEVVLRALAKDPAQRYQQAREVISALERLRTPPDGTASRMPNLFDLPHHAEDGILLMLCGGVLAAFALSCLLSGAAHDQAGSVYMLMALGLAITLSGVQVQNQPVTSPWALAGKLLVLISIPFALDVQQVLGMGEMALIWYWYRHHLSHLPNHRIGRFGGLWRRFGGRESMPHAAVADESAPAGGATGISPPMRAFLGRTPQPRLLMIALGVLFGCATVTAITLCWNASDMEDRSTQLVPICLAFGFAMLIFARIHQTRVPVKDTPIVVAGPGHAGVIQIVIDGLLRIVVTILCVGTILVCTAVIVLAMVDKDGLKNLIHGHGWKMDGWHVDIAK